MKKLIIIFAVLLLIFTSCDTTDPKMPEEKPPGYQEDIPWPSLADSPWPMFRGNPQYTGRSKIIGPSSGNVKWDYDTGGYIEAGAIVGFDNSVIFQTGLQKRGVFKLGTGGELDWFYPVNEISFGTTPLILSDSTIIVSSYIGGKIIALSYSGKEKWVYDTGTYITSRGMNVGLDGTIYFIDTTRTLFALSKNGNLNWKLKFESLGFIPSSPSLMAFSPNGETLYIKGKSAAVFAVDIKQKNIIWSYGNSNWVVSAPLVDSQGNIYFYGLPNEFSESLYLIKLNPSGVVDWEFSISKIIKSGFFFAPTMDYNGNIYFGVLKGGTEHCLSLIHI